MDDRLETEDGRIEEGPGDWVSEFGADVGETTGDDDWPWGSLDTVEPETGSTELPLVSWRLCIQFRISSTS